MRIYNTIEYYLQHLSAILSSLPHSCVTRALMCVYCAYTMYTQRMYRVTGCITDITLMELLFFTLYYFIKYTKEPDFKSSQFSSLGQIRVHPICHVFITNLLFPRHSVFLNRSLKLIFLRFKRIFRGNIIYFCFELFFN